MAGSTPLLGFRVWFEKEVLFFLSFLANVIKYLAIDTNVVRIWGWVNYLFFLFVYFHFLYLFRSFPKEAAVGRISRSLQIIFYSARLAIGASVSCLPAASASFAFRYRRRYFLFLICCMPSRKYLRAHSGGRHKCRNRRRARRARPIDQANATFAPTPSLHRSSKRAYFLSLREWVGNSSRFAT